jgi:hypothetical protein
MSPAELLNHALVEDSLTEAQRSGYGRELRALDYALEQAIADDAAGCAGKHEAAE